MSRVFGSMADLNNANGWIVDTSVAVCLQVASWTAEFLAWQVAQPYAPQIRIAPTAYSNGEDPDEFSEQLDADHQEIWRSAADGSPGITSEPFTGDDRQAVQNIIRASRSSGRSISRADAEGIHLAKQSNFALLTGDNRQAEIAINNGVTVVHRATVLEYMADTSIMPLTRLCAGLLQTIANSFPGCPCALPDARRARLEEIYRQKCPANINFS